ncbi:MAG: hypothetical protein EDQ89_02580 [Acidobacteria bacterium]|nr:MAG: hypothetical protein EDQ89_02580 [Acidobacteriota bacterium]MCL4287341.1 hypothetical protein [Thermoleophilia bacterium]GIK76421.1 MAG: hypothetical protein BroJett022_01110 [Actinomycetes bacterium]
MRELADAGRVRRLAAELGRIAPRGTRVYLVGGATAVLEGWRESTVDVDLKIEPESEQVMRAIPGLKERLATNIEFATPADFMPELPGWRERSRFRFRSGNVEVLDYDLYAQALAKVERGFDTDRGDVDAMLNAGLVEPARLRELFAAIEPELFRFPAIDPDAFREKLERALR